MHSIYQKALALLVLLLLIIAVVILLPSRTGDIQPFIPPLRHLSSSTNAYPSVTPNSPGDPYRQQRSTFRLPVAETGTPDNSANVIELEGRRIYTSGQPKLTLHRSTAGRQAYFVQFTSAIEPEWKSTITRIGGVIHGYIPKNTLSVDLSPNEAKNLARHTFVHWISPILPEYKTQPFLQRLHDLRDTLEVSSVHVTISTFTPDDLAAVTDALSQLPVTVISSDAGRRWGWIRAEIPLAEIPAIAAIHRVQWIEEFVEPSIVNNQAVSDRHLRATNVWFTHGLSGQGQIIGHADTGLDLGSMTNQHPDFAGRILAAFARGRVGLWNDPNGHGTHTAGSIFGNGTMSTGIYRGVAWQAQLVHQSLLSSSGGLGGLPTDLNDLYRQAYTNGARIHANSWGSSLFGIYSTYSRQSDEFMWDNPDMLLVFAAGNDGYDDNADGVVNPDSMGAPGTAKNLLTVGAMESDRPYGDGGFTSFEYGWLWPNAYPVEPIGGDLVSESYDQTNQGMAAFSSRGPTDDGRIKPDVVAPGTDIVSVRSRASNAGTGWGIKSGNTNYTFNGGTSMSTPLVAGAAALVRQYLQQIRHHDHPSAALIKATLMHGARSMAPGQYGTGLFQEIPSTTPNSVEGWGQVDLEGSLFPAQDNWYFADEKIGLSAPQDGLEFEFFAETGMVKITMNYTDYPATAGSGKKLVNDLDLSLRGPAGFVAFAGPDRTNTTEQLRQLITVSGVYTARVEAFNVPNGPQPFAMVFGGPVVDKPTIVHTPLTNTYETNSDYRVVTRIVSASPVATNAVSLFWRDAGTTADFARVMMTGITNNTFEGYIPAHPNPTEINYYIMTTSLVFTTTAPENAPVEVFAFHVTDAMTLTVSATPAPVFSVSPDYGVHTFASGNVVRLSAPAFTNLAPGMRLAIAGWTGAGSVPSSGVSNEVEIVIREASSITWDWVTQHALTYTSNVAGIFAGVSWWNVWSAASTPTANMEMVHNGTSYGLAGWSVDGQRQPNATSIANNPANGIIMYAARGAIATYLPAQQDLNVNGLPDWWEQFYFGTNATVAAFDSDDDGFTNLKEFQDRTNPRDGLSIPQPPAIAHLPLANPQPLPAPWSLHAIIADNHAVSNASVFWQRNGGAWTSAPMYASATTNFSGTLVGPGTNGDTIAYRIEATDFAGLTAVNGPFHFTIQHPVLRARTNGFGEIGLPSHTITNLHLAITNIGLAGLIWSLDRALLYDHIENGTGSWTHAGQSNVWHIGTNRSASSSRAWHFGKGPSGFYPDNAHAWLISEPIHLDAAASLFFDHWAKMEYDDEQQDDHYWDGAVIDLSLDDGITFFTIDPVGGYPHRITANPASPFPPNTPCFGETLGWETAEFDLAAYVGETVRVRFRFGSDGYVVDEGWYIDNVRIRYPDVAAWTWLAIQTNGLTPVDQSTDALITLDSSPLALAEKRHAVLVLTGNDPTLGAPLLFPIALHNISRAITVTHSAHGTVAPDGVVQAVVGDDVNFWIQPEAFHAIGHIVVDGEDVYGALQWDATTFTWTNVQHNGTLHVEFAIKFIDGLVPEWWLYFHDLTNHSPSIEAQLDPDGDGMLTWQEYQAHTDPTNAASVAMPLIRITPFADRAIVEWLSFTNTDMTYDIETTTNLHEGFHALATNLPATPPINTYTNIGSGGFKAYRIIAAP